MEIREAGIPVSEAGQSRVTAPPPTGPPAAPPRARTGPVKWSSLQRRLRPAQPGAALVAGEYAGGRPGSRVLWRAPPAHQTLVSDCHLLSSGSIPLPDSCSLLLLMT